MLPELFQILKRNWKNHFGSVEVPSQIHYVGALGSIEGGSTTFLGFHPLQENPLFVVKVHRHFSSWENAKEEAAILEKLAQKPALKNSVPQLIYSGEVQNTWVTVQSILRGAPMPADLNLEGLPDLNQAKTQFRQVTHWALTLAQDTGIPSFSLIQKCTGDLELLKKKFKIIFKPDAHIISFLDDAFSAMPEILNRCSPVFHGDFCRHNLLIDEASQLGVIDWTFGKITYLPALDPLFFFATYFLQVRKSLGIKGFIESFHRSFFENNPYSQLIKTCMDDYCQTLQISSLSSLFAVFLVDQAVSYQERLARCAQYGPLPRFPVYLASLKDKSFSEAVNEQIWIYFFHHLLENKDKLIFN